MTGRVTARTAGIFLLCGALFAVVVGTCTGSRSPDDEAGREAGGVTAEADSVTDGDTTPDARVPEALRREVREADGRVLVHFRTDGAKDDGARPDTARIRELAEGLCCDVLLEIHRVFSLVPAVSATVEPDRLDELLASPRVRYVEPDRKTRPHPDGAS